VEEKGSRSLCSNALATTEKKSGMKPLCIHRDHEEEKEAIEEEKGPLASRLPKHRKKRERKRTATFCSAIEVRGENLGKGKQSPSL